MTTEIATRRTTRERVRRLVRHPIRTIRESLKNRNEREWQLYYAAAIQAGQSETNSKNFADQITHRTMRSVVTKQVKLFLRPHVKLIRARQNVKEKILLLIDKNNQLAAKSHTPHLPSRKRREIALQQKKIERQINAMAERLETIDSKINDTLQKRAHS